MEQKKLPDFRLSSEGLELFPEEFKNKPFKDWEDTREGIEDSIKIAIDTGTYNITGGIRCAVKNALGPFYNDIPKVSIDIFTEKVKVFEKEFLERCPGLREKMEKDLEIRGIGNRKKSGISNKKSEKKEKGSTGGKKVIESDYEHFINYGKYPKDEEEDEI